MVTPVKSTQSLKLGSQGKGRENTKVEIRTTMTQISGLGPSLQLLQSALRMSVGHKGPSPTGLVKQRITLHVLTLQRSTSRYIIQLPQKHIAWFKVLPPPAVFFIVQLHLQRNESSFNGRLKNLVQPINLHHQPFFSGSKSIYSLFPIHRLLHVTV